MRLALLLVLVSLGACSPLWLDEELPHNCDSDCVVTCFLNQKVWENKCLFICGCEDSPPEGGYTPVDLPDFNVTETALILSDCDSKCFTLCQLYNPEADCWEACNCKSNFIEFEK